MPTSGSNLIVVGIDSNGLLHIRIFDADGNLVTDTDETKLPGTQAGAIATLKQQLPGLLPPHVLTDAEKAQVIAEARSIVGRTIVRRPSATVLRIKAGTPASATIQPVSAAVSPYLGLDFQPSVAASPQERLLLR